MHKIIIVIVAYLFLVGTGKGQTTIDRSMELKVGQMIPTLALMPILNYDKQELDLEEYREKVVILDFFDTYCVNCIAAMPKLQQLQDELSDKLQILLVTWQDKETIEKFYANNAYLKKNKVHLPTIYGDTLLKSYFPHKGVPHTAWLFQNKVRAITFSDFVQRQNIAELYTKGAIKLPLKADFATEENISEVDTSDSNLITSLQITGYKDGSTWGGIKMEWDSLHNMGKSYFHNADIFGAYVAAWGKIKKPSFLLKEQRVVWKVKDPGKYRYLGKGGKNEWLLDNGISYQRVYSRQKDPSKLAEIVISDLNAALGLRVYWSEKEIPCLVLKRLSKKKNGIATDEGELGGTSVLAFMIDYQGGFPPVVDEVNSDVRMNIVDFSTLENLNEQLKKYGMVLEEGVRKVEVLVFEDLE
ncbi:TlpA disulfide reductase family protein [Sphingobacterium sp. UT-1RO-CII-1]|uniref:TlpA family protein disulfide reductase n=1 Tax=Sphingobacterium sp. UT-1RO-CII-1 TaxID=2995225 RepID=UPI00227A33B7|nr:TlpA disulfide reductase family protein [Sphingobacterium sp. UT-1RO-CII-1]MCY4778561.1 TlpA disulfide reductase family protein [Sphingobacterium sp. UT-1RO-CII-1]